MTTIRTSMSTTGSRRAARTTRGAFCALLIGAGVALTPLPALASATAPGVAAPTAPVVAATGAAQVAVDTAMAQLGDPYVWAGTGPDVFDCSGLVQYSYAAAGMSLPRTSSTQAQVGMPVSRAELQPGDLVFFYNPIGHVGIYIGNGLMVHAPTAGDVVKVTNIDYMWGYNTARRLA